MNMRLYPLKPLRKHRGKKTIIFFKTYFILSFSMNSSYPSPSSNRESFTLCRKGDHDEYKSKNQENSDIHLISVSAALPFVGRLEISSDFLFFYTLP